MWNNTAAARILGSQYPIMQGPFGGGLSSVALTAAVSNLGGVGGYGVYTLEPDEIVRINKDLRKATNKPYNINIWVSDTDITPEKIIDERFEKTKALAANQGLYNGFLSAGLIWSLLIADPIWSFNVASFFLSCVMVAGIYGALTAQKIVGGSRILRHLYRMCGRRRGIRADSARSSAVGNHQRAGARGTHPSLGHHLSPASAQQSRTARRPMDQSTLE